MQVATKNIGFLTRRPSRSADVRRGFRCARCERCLLPIQQKISLPNRPGCGFIKARMDVNNCLRYTINSRLFAGKLLQFSSSTAFPRVRRAFRTDKRQKMDFQAKILVAMLGNTEWADTIHFPLLLIMRRL